MKNEPLADKELGKKHYETYYYSGVPWSALDRKAKRKFDTLAQWTWQHDSSTRCRNYDQEQG